jgi:segregation and condensation protein B
MSLKAKIEALIYAAEEPIGLDQMASLLKEDLLALKDLPLAEATGNPGLPAEQAPMELQAEDPPEPEAEATPEPTASTPALDKAAAKKAAEKKEKAELRNLLKPILEEVIAGYASEDRGIEIRRVAGGYRMSTKPEHHDVVRSFAKSLKPPIRLSLQALETLAVIAYKQPVTVPEISDIRGVDSSGVIGTLFDRKLITTAGRKAVVGRPMLYKTTKDFLMRFGLSDLSELPSIEEFEKLAMGDTQEDLFDTRDAAIADATGVPASEEEAPDALQDSDANELTENEMAGDAPAGTGHSSETETAGQTPETVTPETVTEETEGIAASDRNGG